MGECKTPVAAGGGAGNLRYVIQPAISADALLGEAREALDVLAAANR